MLRNGAVIRRFAGHVGSESGVGRVRITHGMCSRRRTGVACPILEPASGDVVDVGSNDVGVR